MAHFRNELHACGTTFHGSADLPQVTETNNDRRHKRICENLRALLNQENLDLSDVELKTNCTTAEVRSAKAGEKIELEKQARMLKYFKVSLVSAAFEDLGRHLMVSN